MKTTAVLILLRGVAKTALRFVLLACVCHGAFGQGVKQIIHPILRLEKPEYVLGESIRFWVEVNVDQGAAVEHTGAPPCSISITDPDKWTNTESINWPADGPSEGGFVGGWGFKADQPGLYLLVMECGKERTRPVELMVKANEIIHQISATFEFQKSGDIRMGTSVPVTLKVTNSSPYTIQFPQPGMTMDMVSIHISRSESDMSMFYPQEELTKAQITFEPYDWDVAKRVPSIVLRPGEHFERELLLEKAYKFDSSGEYKVNFNTVVPVLVGGRDGALKNACPIRFVVSSTADFNVKVEF